MHGPTHQRRCGPRGFLCLQVDRGPVIVAVTPLSEPMLKFKLSTLFILVTILALATFRFAVTKEAKTIPSTVVHGRQLGSIAVGLRAVLEDGDFRIG